MSIQHTAYLVAHIYTDPTGRMRPQVHAVRVYSASARNLLALAWDTAALDIYSVRADTYQEAHDSLLHAVQTLAPLAWCRPLMDRHEDVRRVTFGPASNVDALAAHAVVQKFLATSPEHAAKVLAHGTWMDADRYDCLVQAFEAAGCEVPVLWNRKSEAA